MIRAGYYKLRQINRIAALIKTCFGRRSARGIIRGRSEGLPSTQLLLRDPLRTPEASRRESTPLGALCSQENVELRQTSPDAG